MKMFKRIMLAALSLCMALGIVGLVAACGKSKAKKIDYTVTVTCTETEALANVKAGLTTAEGEAVEGGEAKALTDGAATFTVLPGTYQVVLTGVPETYEYQPATLTETTTTATITLTQKTPVGPQGPTIDAKYNGTWSNADHTVVVDAANGTITLDGTQATDIAEDETAGYTFQCGGKTWSLFFTIEDPDTLCLDDGEDDFSELTAGTYVPPTPATMPSDFPAKWYDEDETEAIVFDGANFTYMDEEGVVTAVTDNKDGTYTITATYMEDEISFTWTKADFTLSLTVYDTLVTYYAEGHVPFHIDGAFDGTWTSFDGETTIVIDAEGATITIGEDAATGIALAADGSYTFTWNGESCSIYFVDDDYTTLHFKYGTMDPVKFRQGIMPPAFPATWYDETGEVALTFEGATFTYSDGEGVVTEATETENNWDFQGTYTFEGMDPFTFTAEWAVEEGTLTLHIDMGDDAEPQTAVFYATPQGGDVGGGDKVDIPDSLNGTYQDEAKTYTVVVDATNDTITINDVEVTNLAEADFGYDFDWNGKSWNFWGLAGSFTLDGTGDNAAVSISLYLVEDENTVDVAEEFDGKWYDEKYFTEGVDASEILLEVSAANDTISINGSNVKELATDEATGGYTFTFDNAQYKLYFTGEDHTTLYLAKGEAAPTALHKKDWKPTEPEVTLPADFPTLWESKDHGEVLTFDGTAFTYTADNEELKGTVTAVTDNQDGTYTLTATYNGGYELTLTYDSSAQKSLKLAGYGWEYATELQVRLPNQIDAAYAGTWSNKTYTVVVDIEKNTITINGTAATDIAADETTGYTFTWDEVECSLYFLLGDSTHATINFAHGGDLVTLKQGEYVPPQPKKLPANFPTIWQDENTELLTFDEEGFFHYMDGRGYFTDTEHFATTWVFTGTYEIADDGGELHITASWTENATEITINMDEQPMKFTALAPAGLDGTYYEGSGSGMIIKIEGIDATISMYDVPSKFSITAYAQGKITLTALGDDEGVEAYQCTFDAQKGTLSIIDDESGEPTTVFYKELPHISSYPEGFASYVWHTNDEGDARQTITFENAAGGNFTYLDKSGYIYYTKDYGYGEVYLYAFYDGKLLDFTWEPEAGTLTLDADEPIVFYDHDVFDPAKFFALGLDGTWYGDAQQGGKNPVKLTFTAQSTDIKLAINGINDSVGKVIGYDEATHTITAEIISTYYFIYDPDTGIITDGNPEGADSIVKYGPYYHYTYSFDPKSAPDWYAFTFEETSGNGTLSFNGTNAVINGENYPIRCYNAEKGELLILKNGKHASITFEGGTLLKCTTLQGSETVTYVKAPDPVDPELEWLEEYPWKAAEGTIEFSGVNVTLHVTNAEWTGYICDHAEEGKKFTVHFTGHSNVEFTYDDAAASKTVTGTVNGKEITFTQDIPLTLPEALNGTTWTPDSTNFDAKSITFENGKLNIESSGNLGGTYDITVTSHDEGTKTWNFEINAVSGKKEFVYVEEPESLTVDPDDRWNKSTFTKKVEDIGGDTSQLPVGLQNTVWDGVNGNNVLKVAFDTSLTLNYTEKQNSEPTTAAEMKDLTNTDGTWTFYIEVPWVVTTAKINFTYVEATNTLTAVKNGGTYTFTKQGGEDTPSLELPEAIYNSSWTSDNTSYGYSIAFTATEVTIQTNSYGTPATSAIENLQYDSASKTWTFTALWKGSYSSNLYEFTYVEESNTIQVQVWNEAKTRSIATFTLTKAE